MPFSLISIILRNVLRNMLLVEIGYELHFILQTSFMSF